MNAPLRNVRDSGDVKFWYDRVAAVEAEAERKLKCGPQLYDVAGVHLGAVGEKDGADDVCCRLAHHPYKISARHIDLIGTGLWTGTGYVWSGVKSEKKNKGRHVPNARPRRDWCWATTVKIYQSPRVVEGPNRIITLLDFADDDGDDGDVSLHRLAHRAADILLGASAAPCAATGINIPDPFVWMAGWRRFLPGLVKDRDTHVIAALRAAFWIRGLHSKMSGDGSWTGDSDVIEAAGYQRRRVVTKDDIAAARLVISRSVAVMLRGLRDKPKWRAIGEDGNFVPDWSILKLVLDEKLSIREAAQRLGLNHVGAAKRFNDAITAITDSLGPMPWRSLNKQKADFVRRVERADAPALLVQPRPALPALPRVVAGVGTFWTVFRPCDEIQALIAKAAARVRRVPAGCAIGYPPEPPRDRAALTRWHPDNDPDENGTFRTEPGLWTEGRHVIRAQRAADWRSIAKALPTGDRAAALAREKQIRRVLNDTTAHEHDSNPYQPTSKTERRFATRFYNHGIDANPRRETDGYYGPVKWHDGEWVPRSYESGPRDKREVDAIFDAAVNSDPIPFFETA